MDSAYPAASGRELERIYRKPYRLPGIPKVKIECCTPDQYLILRTDPTLLTYSPSVYIDTPDSYQHVHSQARYSFWVIINNSIEVVDNFTFDDPGPFAVSTCEHFFHSFRENKNSLFNSAWLPSQTYWRPFQNPAYSFTSPAFALV